MAVGLYASATAISFSMLLRHRRMAMRFAVAGLLLLGVEFAIILP